MIALLMTMAMAGTVYVNGVDVGDMRSQTFENCTLVFDSAGDLHVSAPGYEIQVMDALGPLTAPPPAQGPMAVGTPPPASVPVASAPAGAGVTQGEWWLVTDDSGSSGHAVDIFVNGAMVKSIHSGEAQIIVDLGPWLVPGANRVHLQAQSNTPAGGPLYIYLGRGSNASGTVMMDSPDIQFGLGPSRNGETSRDYTLQVP